jgi:predicted metalloprotease
MFKRLAIALALLTVLLAPGVVRAQSDADLIFADLDAYWSQQLAERGTPYSTPRFKFVEFYGQELCGFLDAYEVIGGYCSPSNTLTLSTQFLDPNDLPLVLTILGHEFGHHIQNISDTGISSALEAELQADCFSGSFIRYAVDAGWISPAVASLAMQQTQMAGDVWWMFPDEPNIHGNQADRVIAYWAGYNGGLEACGI